MKIQFAMGSISIYLQLRCPIKYVLLIFLKFYFLLFCLNITRWRFSTVNSPETFSRSVMVFSHNDWWGVNWGISNPRNLDTYIANYAPDSSSTDFCVTKPLQFINYHGIMDFRSFLCVFQNYLVCISNSCARNLDLALAVIKGGIFPINQANFHPYVDMDLFANIISALIF